MPDNPKTAQANASFKKLQRDQEAKKNLSDYEANEAAVAAKTARLRAARLARDAELALTNPPAPAKKKVAKKTKGKSVNLSDWLKNQQSGGRNS